MGFLVVGALLAILGAARAAWLLDGFVLIALALIGCVQRVFTDDTTLA